MLNDLINVLFCPESNLSISFIIFVWHNRLLENHKNAITNEKVYSIYTRYRIICRLQ